MSLTFGELARLAGGTLLSGNPETPVRSFSLDSRSVGPGEVFVAIKGEKVDAHDFVPDVLSRGAGGALVSRPVAGAPAGAAVLQVPDVVRALQEAARRHRAGRRVRVVGITGSNGKTSTKEMIAQVLAAGGKALLATQGNLNSQIGLPLMVMELNDDHTHAVFEMGASEKGNIAALARVAVPDVGVLTNVGKAHLEFFGSVEGVADAKWELVESLPAGGLAVLNADDPRLMARRARARCRVRTYGLSPAADVRAEDVVPGPETSFILVSGGLRTPVRLPVSGTFNVSNALAAAAVAFEEGLSPSVVAAALAVFRPAAQRMNSRKTPRGALFLLDAYNANPDSMAASLESFAKSYPSPRVVVLGSMRELGPHAEAEHRALGERLARLSFDAAFFLGPEGGWVSDGFRAAGGQSPLVLAEEKAGLRAALSPWVAPGRVLLFKASRGVKMEEVYEPFLKTGE